MNTSFNYAEGQAFVRDSFVPFKDANVRHRELVGVVWSERLYCFQRQLERGEKKRYAFRLKDHYKRLVIRGDYGLQQFAPAWRMKNLRRRCVNSFSAMRGRGGRAGACDGLCGRAHCRNEDS